MRWDEKKRRSTGCRMTLRNLRPSICLRASPLRPPLRLLPYLLPPPQLTLPMQYSPQPPPPWPILMLLPPLGCPLDQLARPTSHRRNYHRFKSGLCADTWTQSSVSRKCVTHVRRRRRGLRSALPEYCLRAVGHIQLLRRCHRMTRHDGHQMLSSVSLRCVTHEHKSYRPDRCLRPVHVLDLRMRYPHGATTRRNAVVHSARVQG